MKRIWRVILGFLVFFVPLLILCVFLEMTFRYVELRKARELPNYGVNGTYVPVRMRSNYRGTVMGIPVSLNHDGLRDEPDFNPVPPAGEYRILSMGDSIAFGFGINSKDCYAKVLERRLNQKGGAPHYYVINAAGPGTSPSCYYLALKNEALDWHPSMVLMEIELTNDVTDEALSHWEMDPLNPDHPRAVRGGRYVISWDGMILSAYVRGPFFYEKTYTYAELSRRILNLLYRFSSPKPYPINSSVCYYTLQHEWYLLNKERIESGWTRMFASLRETSKLLQQRNVDFLLMIMPSLYVFEKDTGDLRNQFARGLVTRAVQFAKQNGIHYIDFTECIAAHGGKSAFLDTVHPNQEANLAIGSALYEHLAGILGQK
jgi:hypothetical protein